MKDHVFELIFMANLIALASSRHVKSVTILINPYYFMRVDYPIRMKNGYLRLLIG